MSLKDLKPGMNLSLAGKIISLIGAAVLGVCVETIGVTYVLLSSTFDELGQKELATDAIGELEGAVDELNAVLALLENGNGEKL